MPSYQAPLKDMMFVLNDMLELERYRNLPGFADATPDLVAAILEEAAKFCENELAPLNRIGDEKGCVRHPDGSVTTPPGFKEAYEKFVEGGWPSLTNPVEYGGQGLPHVVGFAFEEMLISANMAFAMYPGLTNGAIAAIYAGADEELKDRYLPKMVEGRWTGTMNLTEPHCGTDLGLIRTKAEPEADGSYRITGTKIFISAGEHDMSENIIHLVLAKLPDAPKGTKGISLFLVPKFLVNDDGTLGERNPVTCGAIEEKMGIHGNSTCVLNYDGAKGWIVGRPNEGLKNMFIMMNAARLGVGLQGLALSEVACQNAVAYAKDRLQGRALSGPKYPDRPADPIIVHPDVRRMLLDARSFNEAARALGLWGALQVDLTHKAESQEERLAADDIISLLTPVIKGVFTDMGFDNCVKAQQVFGGHGYIREWGMEQFVRDARIAMIYEGTNGIQALDLVGRKLALNGGRALRTYFGVLEAFMKEAAGEEGMDRFLEPLERAVKRLQKATMWLMENGMKDRDNAGAVAVDYMHLMGLVALGHMWAQMARVARRKLAEGAGDSRFYENKIRTGEYFMARWMPETRARLAKIEAGAAPIMALADDDF
ncbi:MAG: acyl-CoA dehydrogenase [Alphaproteobacteria bacterium]|nr:MAG: acyl-CoA dehydrogenase [Alphaproteobacteria bacterium]